MRDASFDKPSTSGMGKWSHREFGTLGWGTSSLSEEWFQWPSKTPERDEWVLNSGIGKGLGNTSWRLGKRIWMLESIGKIKIPFSCNAFVH